MSFVRAIGEACSVRLEDRCPTFFFLVFDGACVRFGVMSSVKPPPWTPSGTIRWEDRAVEEFDRRCRQKVGDRQRRVFSRLRSMVKSPRVVSKRIL